MIPHSKLPDPPAPQEARTLLESERDSLNSNHVEDCLFGSVQQQLDTTQLPSTRFTWSGSMIDRYHRVQARHYLSLAVLHKHGYIEWVDTLTSEDRSPDQTFFEYLQSGRMVDVSYDEAFHPVLTSQGVRAYWNRLYRVYREAGDGQTDQRASQFRRRIRQHYRQMRATYDVSPITRLLVVTLKRGTLSMNVNRMVESQLGEETVETLYDQDWIAPIGLHTKKTYEDGRDGRATTLWHLTPTTIRSHSSLIWDLYVRESIRTGTVPMHISEEAMLAAIHRDLQRKTDGQWGLGLEEVS